MSPLKSLDLDAEIDRITDGGRASPKKEQLVDVLKELKRQIHDLVNAVDELKDRVKALEEA